MRLLALKTYTLWTPWLTSQATLGAVCARVCVYVVYVCVYVCGYVCVCVLERESASLPCTGMRRRVRVWHCVLVCFPKMCVSLSLQGLVSQFRN